MLAPPYYEKQHHKRQALSRLLIVATTYHTREQGRSQDFFPKILFHDFFIKISQLFNEANTIFLCLR